ncbi:MAG TPA: HAD family hydrolase [Candidatus Dojkabacteria bacterium]|nr:HAD family hydrolase [Candidatus Dojkabacteria bacterium]
MKNNQNKKYKLIVFDIDGVLNEHGGNILPESKQAIRLLKKSGIQVGYASGKHAWYIQGGLVWSGLLDQDTMIVAENGGVIYDPHTKKTLVEDKFLNDVKLLRSIFYNLYSKNQGFLNFSGLTVWEEPKQSLFCLFPQNTADVPRLAKVMAEIVKINKLNLYIVENPDSVDVIQQGINKATGLKHLCAWSNLDLEDIIAVGDSYNDLEMLAAAGFAITLANGKDEIKKLVLKRKNQGLVTKQACGKGVLEASNYLIAKKLI